jgi:nucleoside-diphosphate-sugar epimerase
MSKYLVSGGSGFIGTNLISFLIYNGHDILNIDIQEPKLPEQKSYFVEVDLCDLEKLKLVITKFDPDFVIHLGARTDLNGKTLYDYQANIQGVSNLILVLDQLKNLNRVIFASSMYVCKPGYSPKDFDDYNPHTVYGKSKVLSEKIIKENNPQYTWTIIRPTSIWGPHFGEPYNLFFKIVLSRKYFHLGNKACKKTYGYIDNFIYQIENILKANVIEIKGKTLYLGDYEPYDITKWANEIADYHHIKIPALPYFVFKLAAWGGDLLQMFGIKFPMTSFRLKNMTTNNIFDLTEIERLAPHLPISRNEGTKITVNWLTTSK